MSEYIYHEIYMFLISIAMGLFIRGIYDVFIILRNLYKHKKIIIGIEDFIYWLFIGLYVFVESFKYNSGNVRGYIICGITIGVIIYHFIISKIIVKILTKIFGIFIKYLHKIFSFIFKFIRKILKIIEKNFIKPLKKKMKLVKIKLVKHDENEG